MLSTLPEAERTALEQFYAGQISAGELSRRLSNGDSEADGPPAADAEEGAKQSTAIQPAAYIGCLGSTWRLAGKIAALLAVVIAGGAVGLLLGSQPASTAAQHVHARLGGAPHRRQSVPAGFTVQPPAASHAATSASIKSPVHKKRARKRRAPVTKNPSNQPPVTRSTTSTQSQSPSTTPTTTTSSSPPTTVTQSPTGTQGPSNQLQPGPQLAQ